MSTIDCAHGIPLDHYCGPCADYHETDPNGRAPHQPGAKLDSGKPPLLRGVIQYFPRALGAVADVSAFGAAKYTWGGWVTVPDGIGRYGDALARHQIKEVSEGESDEDSGLLHAAHAAWNALARLGLILREKSGPAAPLLFYGIHND